MCVCVFVSHIPDWAGDILIIPQECLSLPFLPSVGGEPANRPVIAVNMEMQYSHQDCSARLMDNFCHLSHTPFLFFLFLPDLSTLSSPWGAKWQSHHQRKIEKVEVLKKNQNPIINSIPKFNYSTQVRPCFL